MSEFANDVKAGLSSSFKRLSSKYFYDDEGSRIFQEIMAMPEYYLTDCEMEILGQQSSAILHEIGQKGSFNVIELGAGDGVKTQLMLKEFLRNGASPIYRPIDISQEAVDMVCQRLNRELPDLEIRPEVGDYFELMQKITQHEMPSLVLFLGSNIGNYVPPRNRDLLELIADHMSKGDHFLIGADLRKDPNTIRNAYDDSQGITRRFNLNLLKRINRELGADFDLEAWGFYCHYDPTNGQVRSYLVSRKDQRVHIADLNESFEFERYELIWTELSKKYDLRELKELGESAGMLFKQHFLDSARHFTDTLFLKQ